MTFRDDSARLAVSVLLVYGLFLNPWMQFSNTWNFLDAAVSYADTGRWDMQHARLYDGKDSATSLDGRLVPGVPAGMSMLALPVYVVWRQIAGPARTVADFVGLHTLCVIVIGMTTSALAAVQVAWLAGWLGADRAGRLFAALLFAFGTQSLQLGTVLSKESVTALLVTGATRLAVEPGGSRRRVLAGAAAAAAAWFTHSAALLAPLLAALVAWREGGRRLAALVAGALPLALLLALYNAWLFGRPWRSSYHAIAGLHTQFVAPKLLILVDLLVGPRGGLLLYSPFLVLGLVGIAALLRTARRGEAVVTLVFLAGIWLLAAGWQSQFDDRAGWAMGLGPRHLFPAIPLLAACAGPVLPRVSTAWRAIVVFVSVGAAYLGAQAGIIAESNPFPYAVKTFVSGTGMSVLFKEALPALLGIETLHTVVARPDVSARDLLAMLPTHAGLVLALHQAFFFALNAATAAVLVRTLVGIWRPTLAEVPACAS